MDAQHIYKIYIYLGKVKCERCQQQDLGCGVMGAIGARIYLHFPI